MYPLSSLDTASSIPSQAIQGLSPKVVDFCIQNLQTFPGTS